jgi:hypothetical protein
MTFRGLSPTISMMSDDNPRIVADDIDDVRRQSEDCQAWRAARVYAPR